MNWNRTVRGKMRLERAGKLEKIGGEDYYEGRRVIGRDSPIAEGVYIGEYQREAIVVRFSEHSSLDTLYQEVKDDIGKKAERDILKTVYDFVDRKFTYKSNNKVRAIIDSSSSGDDIKISLNNFIKNGIGVCRHVALTCGAIIERLGKENLLKGRVSVDRNSDKNPHVWCKYESPDGAVHILDVAQSCFGRLDELGKSRWDYRRPEKQPSGRTPSTPEQIKAAQARIFAESLPKLTPPAPGEIKTAQARISEYPAGCFEFEKDKNEKITGKKIW